MNIRIGKTSASADTFFSKHSWIRWWLQLHVEKVIFFIYMKNQTEYLNQYKIPTCSFTYNSNGEQDNHQLWNEFDNNDKTFCESSIVTD